MKIVRSLNLEIIKLLGFRTNLKIFTRAIRKVKISPRDRTAADM